jgi:hypothetical protein
MSNQTYFEISTPQQYIQSLAQDMPNGQAFNAKGNPKSNLYKLLQGLSGEGIRTETWIQAIATNHDINQTVDYITEWESAVGIPDSCFSATGPIEERRTDVIAKLARMNISTKQELIDLAAYFGYEIDIIVAIEYSVFPMDFPYFFTGEGKTNRFTIYVIFPEIVNDTIFPIAFPWVFGPNTPNIIQCIFRKIVAANVRIIFSFGALEPIPRKGFPVEFPWQF